MWVDRVGSPGTQACPPLIDNIVSSASTARPPGRVFARRLASVIQGSTETTFYVIAVYFGAVGIRRTRHAVVCGLAADLAGVTAAILVSYLFFG